MQVRRTPTPTRAAAAEAIPDSISATASTDNKESNHNLQGKQRFEDPLISCTFTI
jgi:hypothetical protein